MKITLYLLTAVAAHKLAQIKAADDGLDYEDYEDYEEVEQPEIYLSYSVEGPLADGIRAGFPIVDTDGNGELNHDELAHLISGAAGEDVPIPKFILHEMINQADEDYSGSLSLDETLNMALEMYEDPELRALVDAYSGAAAECANNKKHFGTCTYCLGDEECLAYHTNKEGEEHTCSQFICMNEEAKYWGNAVKWINEVFMPFADTNGDEAIDGDEIEAVFEQLIGDMDEESSEFLAGAIEAISNEDVNGDGKMTTQEIARALFWFTDDWSPFQEDLPDWFTPKWFAGKI